MTRTIDVEILEKCVALECNGEDRVEPALGFCFSHWHKLHPVLQAAIWNPPRMNISYGAKVMIEAMAIASLGALEGKLTEAGMHAFVRGRRDHVGKLPDTEQEFVSQVAADLTAATEKQG